MMKRFIVAGATLLMALAVAAPSFALETKVTGTLTFDGILNYNPTMTDDSSAKQSIDYRNMQLRVNTESKVNDNITLFTRCNILDKLLSSQNAVPVADDRLGDRANIQFDRAWMQVKTPVGLIRLGRKEGIKWGTEYFDDGDDWGTDRLDYLLPIPVGDDTFVFGAVFEKALETQQQNRDNEKYYVTGTYINKNFKTGLLVGYYDYMSFKPDPGANGDNLTTAYNNAKTAATSYYTLVGTNAAAPGTYDTYEVANALADKNTTSAAFATAVSAYTPRAKGQVIYAAPYFSGKIGPVSVNAEFDYVTGSVQFENVKTTELTSAIASKAGYDPTNPTSAGSLAALAYAQDYLNQAYLNKKDVNMMGYWLELGYDIGPANIQLGYAFMSGDSDGGLNDLKAAGNLAQNGDWGKVFILTSGMGIHNINTALTSRNINGVTRYGNMTNNGSAMNYAGLSMPYLAAKYSVSDKLTLGALFAFAEADQAPVGFDKNYGMETDLSLTWKIMNNLEYKAIAAYLNTGDFWKFGGSANAANGGVDSVGDMISLYHRLTLSF